MNGYLDASAIRDEIAEYITLPGLGSRSGVLGAIALAETARPNAAFRAAPEAPPSA